MTERDIIKRFEGLRLRAYPCPSGVWTVGYGHTGPDVRRSTRITEARAEELLSQDIFVVRAALVIHVDVPLTENQRAALISFVFNVGAGNLAASTLLRKLNAGDYDAVPGELRRWVYGTVKGKKAKLAGLVARREAEAELWSTPE